MVATSCPENVAVNSTTQVGQLRILCNLVRRIPFSFSQPLRRASSFHVPSHQIVGFKHRTTNVTNSIGFLMGGFNVMVLFFVIFKIQLAFFASMLTVPISEMSTQYFSILELFLAKFAYLYINLMNCFSVHVQFSLSSKNLLAQKACYIIFLCHGQWKFD